MREVEEGGRWVSLGSDPFCGTGAKRVLGPTCLSCLGVRATNRPATKSRDRVQPPTKVLQQDLRYPLVVSAILGRCHTRLVIAVSTTVGLADTLHSFAFDPSPELA